SKPISTPSSRFCHKAQQTLCSELLETSEQQCGAWHTVPLIRRGQDGCAAELCVAGLCRKEEAHEARRVSGRDGGGGAVVEAGSIDRAALSESWPSGRPSAVRNCRDGTHLLPAAVV